MCVLSGCDYLKSLKGIGIKKAKKVVEQAEDNNIEWTLDNLIKLHIKNAITMCS